MGEAPKLLKNVAEWLNASGAGAVHYSSSVASVNKPSHSEAPTKHQALNTCYLMYSLQEKAFTSDETKVQKSWVKCF